MSDLLQVMLSGRPVWCRRLAEQGMHPSASLIEAWKSGHDGFGGSLKSLVVSVEVAGLATTGTLTVELAAVARRWWNQRVKTHHHCPYPLSQVAF